MFLNNIDTFDLIFSLGDACSCTETLRLAKLQNISYPFDWLLDGDFKTRTNILLNEFNDFFNKEDLELVDSYKNNHVYTHKKTKITYIHDFYNDKNFEDAYIEVSAKYQRRQDRLLDDLRNAKTALIVYVNSPNKEMVSNSDLKEFSEKIQTKYPNCKINILYFYNLSDIQAEKAIIKQLENNLTKVLFEYNAHTPKFVWEINREKLLPFLNNFSLSC